MQIAKLGQYGLLHAGGDDARAFLHAQLTNDVENLAPDRVRFAGWCSAKGRLLATLLVVPCAGGFLLQLSRDLAPAVAKRLQMFILRSKVELTDVTDQWQQWGFWDEAALAALGLAVPGSDLELTETQDTIAVRVEPQRFLVLTKKEMKHEATANASAESWTLAEIRAGRPLVVQATEDQFVPQMLNLELTGGVDFRKGCYPGQEIVARAQYRGAVKRRMYRLRGGPLQPGQDLFSDDAPEQASGTVVNSAGDESLAVLQISAVEAGAPFREQPHSTALEILPLPYSW